MLVEERQNQRTQVLLLWLQVKRVRSIGDEHKFVFDAGLLQRGGEDLGLLNRNCLVGRTVQDQERRVFRVGMSDRRRELVEIRSLVA